MQDNVGIVGFGAYVPRLRLSRAEIAGAHAWSLPPSQLPAGERALAGWDEDVITMAVEAARESLEHADLGSVQALFLGSTTAPFADRLNAGVVAAALNLDEWTVASDLGGSQRAGLLALRSALETVTASPGRPAVAVAAERSLTPAMSSAEMTSGHGAAAVLVGAEPGIARLVGSATLTVDFVDHFRASGADADYTWEERWVRDEGYLKLIPRALERALQDAGLAAESIDRLAIACPPRVADQLAARMGVPKESVFDPNTWQTGHMGTAQPLVLLVAALERMLPGEHVAVVSFGQGVDAMIFEATEAITSYPRDGKGVSKWLTRRAACPYTRYATLEGLLRADRGIRAEADKGSALTAMYRNRALLTSLIGGRCKTCSTYQIPRQRLCVNPSCNALDSQEPHSFAHSNPTVVSWSADSLTYSLDPPAYYGIVDFPEGGRLMMDFTDIDDEAVVGSTMRLVFRIKDVDRARGFVRYFWKATPLSPEVA